MCSRPEDGTGQILLYKSQDVIHWEFVSILAYNHKKMGKVWECPDFFLLDGKQVLMVSPQEMESDGYEYHPGYNTIAFLGSYDRENYKFIEELNHAIDYGIDFYAPQTIQSFDGRRIMIAWMSNWDTTSWKNPGDHFYAQMSLPRELHVKNNHLYQTPVRELDNYRIGTISHENVLMTGKKGTEDITLDGIKGRFLDLTIYLTPTEEDSYHKFNIKLAMDEKHYFFISYDPEESTLHVDRKYTGARMDTLHDRTFAVADQGGKLKLRIILDRYSAELFVNDGEQAASFVFFTPLEADGIAFHPYGSVNVDVEQHTLRRD